MPELKLNEQQLATVHSLFDTIYQQFPGHSLERLRSCVDMIAAGSKPVSPHANQRPEFYYPGMSNTPWYEPRSIPACRVLEENWTVIRAELESLLGYRKGFETFAGTYGERESYVKGDMNVFYLRDAFTTQPDSIAANRALCPETARILDSLPRRGETAFFSALNPDTFLAPHCGAENLRPIIHLGLKIPQGDCAIEVSGIRKNWHEGQCIVLDDSFDHSAWNRTETTRFILLLDAWNPELNDAEIRFFQTVGPLLNQTPVTEFASLDGKTWWK